MKKIFPVLILAVSLASQTAPVAAQTWTLTGSMAVARRDHTATLLTSGKVLVVGWYNTQIAELYDPPSGTFIDIGTSVYLHGQGSTATRLADGRVLIVGGTQALYSAEIFDPSDNSFTATGSTNYVHCFHTATLLPDGTVLIAAGQDFQYAQSNAVAELYNPSTGTFSLTLGQLKVDRTGHTATLLSNGKVLIAAGSETVSSENGTYALCLSSSELYDPTTQLFTLGATMVTARCRPQATLLPNNQVLMIGDLNVLAELYDPVQNSFSPTTGSMSVPHSVGSLTLLRNGQVLVAGGSTAAGPVATNSAELYDPTTGTFTATASMSVARQEQTGTLLTDGRVLVTGGMNPTDGELSSAELFTPATPQPYSPIAEPLVSSGSTNVYQFASNLFNYEVTYPALSPPVTGVDLVVQPILISQADLDNLTTGTPFQTAQLVVYGGTGGYGVLFRATCQDSSGNPLTCPQTTGPYEVETSWNSPSEQTISAPAFLMAPVGTNAWQNIFTGLWGIDPTGAGRTCCSFSDFVFVDLGASVGPAPTITITTPQDGATYPLGEAVPASYSCTPAPPVPPVVACIGDVPNGSNIDTSSVGSKTFTVNAIVSSGPAGVQTHKYTVTSGPVASVSPSSIDFGTVYLGTITIKTVRVTNQGTAPMTISDPLLSILPGANSKEFVALNLCPKSLAAGKSCMIVVSFLAGPYYNTAQTATLSVMDNAPGSPQTVKLSAWVINPKASLSSYSLNFGKQRVYTTSAAKTVTLTNTGATSLTLSTLNIGGDFSFATGTTCTSGETLTAGASCLISVNFTPTAKGARLGSVMIKDNALLGKQIIVLSGTGN